jgi:hypothetical protein
MMERVQPAPVNADEPKDVQSVGMISGRGAVLIRARATQSSNKGRIYERSESTSTPKAVAEQEVYIYVLSVPGEEVYACAAGLRRVC